MNTTFSEVYSIFLSNLDSYSLYQLLDDDEDAFKEECKNWLIQAITNNPLIYNKTLDFNNSNDTFSHELTLVEIVSLAKLMVIEYLNPYVISEINWRETLNSKTYKRYAPNRHVETLQKIKRDLHEEVRSLIARQTYTVENLKEAFGKKK